MNSVRLDRTWHALSVALLLTGSASLAAAPCDPDLRPPADTPYAYKLRGGHCEGLYTRDVAGNTLNIVSLTEWFEDFTAGAGRRLLVEWAAPANAMVYLRAEAIRPRIYYRMDAAAPSGQASFAWEPSLLKQFQLTRNDIGLLGWALRRIGGSERRVYVPLRISQQRAARRSPRYRLVVVPGVELTEVFVSVASVGDDGRRRAQLVDDQPLGRGYYPAHQPIAIDLEPLPAEGVYLLEIGATVRGGGSAADQIWLFSPGTSAAPSKVPRE